MPHSDAPSPLPSGILKNDSQSNTTYNQANGYFNEGCATNTTTSPRSTPKTVSIGPVSEMISPLMLGAQKSVEDFSLEAGRRPRRPSIKGANSLRLTGKSAAGSSPWLKPSNASTVSLELKEEQAIEDAFQQVDSLIEQVTHWMNEEKMKRAGAHARLKEVSARAKSALKQPFKDMTNDAKSTDASRKDETGDANPDFDKLAEILKSGRSFLRSHGRKSSVVSLRRKLSLKNLQRKASGSETELFENELQVPSSDAVLDNSKTLNYPEGASSESEDSADDMQRSATLRDLDAWAKFKFEILRLVHTLRLKGWRKVPLEMSAGLTVQRLSGALTNAVYVVAPPKNLAKMAKDEEAATSLARKPPPKLLLRIYGPQVEHLIDRESELAILRRLARKRIGPRLLGTFANGRFEEFFNAQTLTPVDLRNPDTSRQIAKRMRELHDGVELLDQERDDGPFVWCNWDKWVQRVEHVVSWLDEQIMQLPPGAKPSGVEAWKRRSFICGVPWKRFREMVERYRTWLESQYGGLDKIKEQLIFAHNDAQYGNILRLIPSGESPLLLPANTHKQLVVIDFEYANANLPGLEFANHFTEWCYNYHDERKPYACNTSGYPTPEEQERFIRSYVRHRPQYNVSSPQMTPQASPSSSSTSLPTLTKVNRRPTSMISDFMLDARAPVAGSSESVQMTNDEETAKASEDTAVARLIEETRMWRVANTAQWVAWGIVQAKVPGMPDFDAENKKPSVDEGHELLGDRADLYREIAGDKPIDEEEKQQVAEEEEFDYLGYAQHRAMFFWGDIVQLGFIKREELPVEVQEKLKIVPF